jgi:hypothetical protein
MLTVADRSPAAEGLNVTVKVLEPKAGMDAPGAKVTVKSAAFAPLIATVPMPSVPTLEVF